MKKINAFVANDLYDIRTRGTKATIQLIITNLPFLYSLKTRDFLMFSGSIEIEDWPEISSS